MHLHCPQRLSSVGDLCRTRALARRRRSVICERNILVWSPTEGFQLEATHLPAERETRDVETMEQGRRGARVG